MLLGLSTPNLFRRITRSLAPTSMAAASITVSKSKDLTETSGNSHRPAHHLNDSQSHFTNPWPSFRPLLRRELGFAALNPWNYPSIPKDVLKHIPVRKPDWGLSFTRHPQDIKATWLGHAAFLVEMPLPSNSDTVKSPRGIRILFDPVLSERCSPFSFMGPARFTPAPCTVDELPDIDIVVISHNHYDHMDVNTLKPLFSRPCIPHIFAPLNNDKFLMSLGIPKSHIHCLDWWESKQIDVILHSSSSQKTTVPAAIKLTCTPSQHGSNRGLKDIDHTLWSSWAVEDISTGSDLKNRVKVWFAGDTSYKTVRKGEDEDQVPACPAFKEIGEKFGEFDLALIPIGAYHPRHLFSPIHVSPDEAVKIFKDVRAKRAIGMHWGTWVLTFENVLEPPKLLAEALANESLPADVFGVCDIGQTVFITKSS